MFENPVVAETFPGMESSSSNTGGASVPEMSLMRLLISVSSVVEL